MGEAFFQPEEISIGRALRKEDGAEVVIFEAMSEDRTVHMRIAIPPEDAWRIAGSMITKADKIINGGPDG